MAKNTCRRQITDEPTNGSDKAKCAPLQYVISYSIDPHLSGILIIIHQPFSPMMPSTNLLRYLMSGGVVVVEGSFIFTMERRGYTKAGVFTPEVVVEHPEAVRQLLNEFVRAGAMAIQAPIYGANASLLAARLGWAPEAVERLNTDAVDLAMQVAANADVWVYGALTPTQTFR